MPSSTRTLHLIASNFVGGPEKQILHHAIAGASSGREVVIGSFRRGLARPEILQHAENLGLPVLELGPARFDPRAVFQLVHGIRKRDISIVCTHGYKANLIGWAACRITACPQIAFARGWTAENKRIRFYESLDRIVLRWTDWVVCVSQPLADEVEELRHRRPAPVVIPNAALFLDAYAVQAQDRAALKRSIGQPEDAFLVCAVGRLSPEKGHRYLLLALPNLFRQIPKLRLLLLGEGQERKRLEEQARGLAVHDRVVFAGFHKNVRPWIQACEVLINPSLTEGVPNAILEAMALGTPVVATAVGGVPDLIHNGKSGLLIPPANPEMLARAIHELFVNPANALHLAANAQVRVQAFSPAKQFKALLELYSRASQSKIKALTSDAHALPI